MKTSKTLIIFLLQLFVCSIAFATTNLDADGNGAIDKEFGGTNIAVWETHFVDASESDQGATASGSGETIYDVMQDVGTTKSATIVFRHTGVSSTTTYTLDTSIDASTYPNIFFIIQNGARLTRVTGDETITFYSPENLECGKRQQITSVDMIDFSVGGDIFPEWWGAVGDDSTDNKNALTYAINASNGDGVVILSTGIYQVKGQMDGITVDRYSIRGPRAERGANAYGLNADYPATIIKYRPASGTDPMIFMYSTDSPLTSTIGPFEHRNITFDFNATSSVNGLAFGNEDVNDDGTPENPSTGPNQRYVFGVRFENCAFLSKEESVASASGVYTRSGTNTLILVRAYEAVIRDCSFFAGDVQLRLYNTDKPQVENCRFQGAFVPIDSDGAGSLGGIQTTVHNCQFESWGIGAIISRDYSGISVSDSRIESQSGVTGFGEYDLTGNDGITASVTADSATLTFSSSVDNIIFPYMTPLKIDDGTNETYVIPTTVNGTSVTIDNSMTTITWTDATANVTRYHGYAIMHYSERGASVSNVAVDLATNAPAFVYVADKGSMAISNAVAQKSAIADVQPIIIGNRTFSASYLNQQLTMSNCTPWLNANPNHPFAQISNWRSDQGFGVYNSQHRSKSGDFMGESINVFRKWVFTPKGTSTSSNNSHLHPFVELDGDSNTDQKIWAWHKRSGSSALHLYDESLASVTDHYLRITFRIRAESGTPNFTWAYYGAGGGGGETIALTTSWKTIVRTISVPSQWSGSKTVNTGFYLTGDTYYLAGIIVEEVYLGGSETATSTYTLRPSGTTLIDSSGGAVTGTLGDGEYIGQIKTVVMTDATTSSTVSVTNHETSDPEVITFSAVDDTAVLMWTGTEWITIKLSGASV